jgi:hypothetical protein
MDFLADVLVSWSPCLKTTGARDMELDESVLESSRLAYSDIVPRGGGGGAAILASE